VPANIPDRPAPLDVLSYAAWFIASVVVSFHVGYEYGILVGIALYLGLDGLGGIIYRLDKIVRRFNAR